MEILMGKELSPFETLINNSGLKQIKIIELLKTSKATWLRKRQNPGDFNVEDIETLSKIFNLMPSQILDILISEKNYLNRK